MLILGAWTSAGCIGREALALDELIEARLQDALVCGPRKAYSALGMNCGLTKVGLFPACWKRHGTCEPNDCWWCSAS